MGTEVFLSYQDALNYLLGTTNYERMSSVPYNRTTFGLDRMKKLLRDMGNPERKFHILHLAGTKGKGSLAHILEAILRAHRVRTGLFVSPHLVDLRERIQVAGRMISRDSFRRHLSLIFPIREKMTLKRYGGALTFFEIMTGLALSYFAREKVEIAILEVGLGGRLDATNVVDPAVSGISVIDFDHTRELGTTIERIAREKAGIIKEGVPTVVASQREEALRVIEEVAHKRGSRLYLVGKDVRLEDLPRKRFSVSTWRTKYEGLRTNLVGRHQRLNIAQAIGMIEVISQKGIFEKDPERIRKALEHVRLPGRFEVLRKRPYLVVDGAHNPVSARALAEAVRGEFPGRQVILVLGMAADKDVEGFLAEVLPLSRRVFTTRIASPRTLEPRALRKRVIRSPDAASGLKPGDVKATSAVGVAIQRALSMAKEEDLVLVTGSFYLVGEVKRIFQAPS